LKIDHLAKLHETARLLPWAQAFLGYKSVHLQLFTGRTPAVFAGIPLLKFVEMCGI
jgi:hypothetical protein